MQFLLLSVQETCTFSWKKILISTLHFYLLFVTARLEDVLLCQVLIKKAASLLTWSVTYETNAMFVKYFLCLFHFYHVLWSFHSLPLEMKCIHQKYGMPQVLSLLPNSQSLSSPFSKQDKWKQPPVLAKNQPTTSWGD